jgi:hypothetical protein
MASKPKPNRFGTMLRRLIKQRHLSQQAFALKVRETTGVRIAQGMLSEVLNGKVAVPRPSRRPSASPRRSAGSSMPPPRPITASKWISRRCRKQQRPPGITRRPY